MATAVIAVQNVRFTILYDNSGLIDTESTDQIRCGYRAAVDRCDHRSARNLIDLDAHAECVSHRRGAVIGDIKVQIPVAIDISQRHRHAACVRGQASLSRDLAEAAFAVVQEAARAATDRIDKKIQVPVTIDVGERGSRRVLAFTRHSRGGGNILELPTTEVAIKDVRAIQTAEVEIAQTVTIDISRGDT